jgi:hypothetical protein
MSRREAWNAGRRDLIRVPEWEMPAFLDADKDAVELTVRDNGLIAVRNELYFGRDEMLYSAGAMKDRDGYVSALPPRTRVLAEFNPCVPGRLWILSKDDGRTLGVCPAYSRAPAYDRHAVEAAMGAQSHDLAQKLLPLRGRHQDEAERRVARIAHNAAVLSGAVPAPAPAASAPAAPAAESAPFPEEDDADAVAALLGSITAN